VMIACLSPLPFIMRRPKHAAAQPSAAHWWTQKTSAPSVCRAQSRFSFHVFRET